MTNEDAINGLKSLVEVRRKYGDMQTMRDEIECLDMAIEALKAEPCGDAVSQKIDEFELKGKTAEIWIVKGKLQIRYLGIIHNVPLPTVTPKQRWIPVSERYPEDYENVLITYGKGVFMGCTKENHSRWCMMHYYGSFETDGSEVTAWMSLPAPYKEGADNGND